MGQVSNSYFKLETSFLKFLKRRSGIFVLFELVFLLMVLRLSCSETDDSLEIDQDTLMISCSVLHFLSIIQ